ncbi:permeases of the major facilitator [Aspergillus oryzae 100-8]|uniref:Permease of the major facilitator superfamily n=1 Tax=Aspergillus oryzae (strain 3.042) TaxID=1160506 RepID=I8TLL6_ASPO3|nr:permease of the major facilitator superfamily [Aspergillus oryzae 3.042]KDE81250.1 permeases of the major facilitator [Aspergillus oryzae 100-8]|eukprot:EIT75055.1 permease of the major facilitator superfamily [Aspergillus oryzae 3.042]
MRVNNSARRPRNPLLLRTPEELEDDVHKFYDRNNLKDVVDLELLVKGARIAQEPDNLYTLSLTPAEFKAIKDEKESGFWQQSKDLKVTILTTACAAITQYVRLAGSHIIFRLQLTNSYRGWQQSTINAGSEGWKHDLSPQGEDWTQSHLLLGGFIDAAPWLSGSIIGTWLSDPLQEGNYGRRPALFISAVFCAACVLGTARCVTWQQLLACRVILGIGIGAKASIAPVFAAEAAVDHLRGRLLMMWQLFDTFGVFLGFACDWIVDRQWRVLLGTASIPALILLFLVFLCPESPRFLIRRGDYTGAFVSLRQLRGTDIQAARDLYYIHSQLQVETEMFDGKRPQNWYSEEIYQKKVRDTRFLKRIGKLFSHPRNQRACVAAFLVMASQQLCVRSTFSRFTLLDSSVKPRGRKHWIQMVPSNVRILGFGLANFLFTIPAYRYIDWRGRRLLLLISLAGMFLSLLAIGLFFRIETYTVRLALVSTFTIGFFTFFYGIGAGPVPFTFSAEVFPLAFREVGMSFSVMVNFLGLGLLVLFVPKLTDALGNYGESKLCFLFMWVFPVLSVACSVGF